ncbi:conserved hypothetical protein [Anaeromyxobacter sp. K]|uniref:SGNH/GDSL hydrolase family protein n=1 Tax=Anaeromyxobacter sp. (strain K) TaxID=447217 RepID=UPI00015F853C|nr:SGNH/GDSL hydrolase family protein [Anaeromyxobacter sp. K]ACG74094.1 conserved hypothetical protein [Anaeromyxobacter sp. K]
MTTPPLAVHALLGLAAFAAMAVASRVRAEPRERRDLQAVSERRVFFGHQSVGGNVIQGLQDLAAQQGVPLRIVEARAPGVGAGTFAHEAVAENGDPMRKLRSFSAALAPGGEGAGAEVALLKFCYVDIHADTDVASLFAAYRKTIAELQAVSPATTFVHVTAPLQTVEGGVRGWAKELLGKPRWGTQHNARREEFNALMRREYGGKAPLFDLARVESTRPDGSAETSAWQGGAVPSLVPAYTDDGGHLNAEGRARAARALASVIASVPREPAPAAAR